MNATNRTNDSRLVSRPTSARKTYNLYDLLDVTDLSAFRATIGCRPLTSAYRYLAPRVSRLASDTLDAAETVVGFALAIAGFVVALLTAMFAPLFAPYGYAAPNRPARKTYPAWTSSPSRPALAVATVETIPSSAFPEADADYETWSGTVSRTEAEQASIDAEIERIAAKYGIGRSSYVPYTAPVHTPTETIDGYVLPIRPIELPVLMSPVHLSIVPPTVETVPTETVETPSESPSVKMGKPGKPARRARSAAKITQDARKPAATRKPVPTVQTCPDASSQDCDPVRSDAVPLFVYKRPNAGARGGYRPVSPSDPQTAPRFVREGRKYVRVSGPKS